MVGKIVSTKCVDSDWGTTIKMLFVADDGQKVWGTVPSKIFEAVREKARAQGFGTPGVKGSRIEFTATVQASQDDPKFGFFKRPSKAKLISLSDDLVKVGC